VDDDAAGGDAVGGHVRLEAAAQARVRPDEVVDRHGPLAGRQAVRHGDEQPALEGPDLRDVAGDARRRLAPSSPAMMRAANSEDIPRTVR
jgi:hypothetical protein